MTFTIRTVDEIVDRYRSIRDSDMLGWKSEVLLPWLPFGRVKEFLKPDTEITVEEWEAYALELTKTNVLAEAVDYLEFAVGKAEDHRGVSAGRSIDKLEEYCWLLGAAPDFLDAAEYPQYGVPKLRLAAGFIGWPWPDDEDLARMAEGLPCYEGCESGCGQ